MEEDEKDAMGFASCVRGHVQHEWDEEDNTCCGGGDVNGASDGAAEAEALYVANELARHVALFVAWWVGTSQSVKAEEHLTLTGIQDPHMCPECCSRPLFNHDCSDMLTHHGECSTTALRRSIGSGGAIVKAGGLTMESGGATITSGNLEVQHGNIIVSSGGITTSSVTTAAGLTLSAVATFQVGAVVSGGVTMTSVLTASCSINGNNGILISGSVRTVAGITSSGLIKGTNRLFITLGVSTH
eukprot:8065363-Ditylum_brightwellii.AAC.1